jgi:hypothetical protein
MAHTDIAWPETVNRQRPSIASQTFTVPSFDADASRRALGSLQRSIRSSIVEFTIDVFFFFFFVCVVFKILQM